MIDKDLKAFGQTLRQLRQAAGLYQEVLAEKLNQIHAKIDPKTDLRLDGNRISKWERAFKSKDGREWRPKRLHVLYLIEVFVDHLTLGAARQWALQAGYRLDNEDLQKVFQSRDPASRPAPPLPNLQTNLKRLAILPDQRLFGIDREREQLYLILEEREAPWLIAIDGIGGIGKTSLAVTVAHEIMLAGRFYDAAWVSAKQEEFLPRTGLQPINRPALDAETLTNHLLEQLGNKNSLTRSPKEKLAILIGLVKQAPYLIIIDNLETVTDYEALLPLLGKLANPGKILLTTRHRLHDYPEVFCLGLRGLGRTAAVAFLRYQAKVRGLPELVDAPEAALDSIYDVVGGNPLALKLVVGQTRALPLSHVLESLKQARGKKVDDLYTYIYWQVWRSLTPAGQEVLLMMPLAQNGTFAHLSTLCRLEVEALREALEQLVMLSLVEVGGDVKERRYRIHRLTETFLLNEVARWQTEP